MKKQTVSPERKGYEKHFLLDGVEVCVGVGGIHSKNNPEIIIPNENQVLLDSDVNSLYPSLIIEHNFVPKHLGKEWLNSYTNIRTDRLYAKKNGLKVKNETYKLSLNGASGNFQNQHSWMYDPIAVMKIRINGQLLLLMLTERIIAAGGKMIQINTDGILYLFDKNRLNELNEILQTEEFEAFYQYAINDYLGVLKGFAETNDYNYLKRKGLFIDTVTLGKGMQPVIIPKALTEYFINGTPIEETIRNCKNLNDFITYQKVSKDYKVEYDGKLISRINRYYASTNGYYLFKCKVDAEGNRTDYNHMLKASGVTIVNNLDDVKEFPTNINYRYYIGEVNKIIKQFENRQLSLF